VLSALVAAPLLLTAATADALDLRFRWAYPEPQGNPLHGLAFESAATGWAVGARGIVLRTIDGGTSWEMLHDHESIDGDLYDVVAVGGSVVVAVGEGIFRSTDGGVSFAPVANPAPGYLRDVTTIPGGRLSAAGAAGGVVVSTDAGQSWTETGPGVGTIRHHLWRDAQEGWVVGEEVAHRTTDGGGSWSQFVTPPFFGFNDIIFADAQHVVATADFDVATSTDGGDTWVVEPNVVPPLYRFRTAVIDPQHWFITAFLEGGEVWETTDAGETWVQHDDRFVLGYPAIVRTPAGRLVWCSDVGDIRYSDDGGATVHAAVGPDTEAPSAPIRAIHDRGDGTLFAANQPSGGEEPLWLRSDDEGRSWYAPAETPGLYWAMEAAFADPWTGTVGDDHEIAYTSDGGETWGSASVPLGQRVADFDAPSADRLFATTYSTTSAGGVWRSTDGGATWNAFGAGFPTSFQGSAIALPDGTNGTLIGKVNEVLRLYRTTDGGANWAPLASAGLPAVPSDVEWLDVSTGVASVWAGSSPGIYRTTDGGATWSTVSTGRAIGLSLGPNGTGIAWAYYTSEDAQTTTDGGLTWETLEAPFSPPFGNLGSRGVHAACVTDTGFALGGYGNALLFAAPTAVTDAPAPRPVADGNPGPRLAPGRPDPFRDGTRLAFELVAPGRASLSVYDVAGRRVARLLDRRLEPGRHVVAWDGRDVTGRPVPAGVYFVRLESPGGTDSRRLTRLR
jgi:photosystem II stability/assembly factor-like uncharacterized protein